MKIKSFLLVVLLLGWLGGGCSIYPGTRALHLGMTRDEVIKVMGPPNSVSAQASAEILNYMQYDSRPYMNTSRPYYIRLINGHVDSYGLAGQFPSSYMIPATATATLGPGPAQGDGIRILSIEPAAVVPGQATEVKVKVRYSLQSLPQALIDVSFNVISPTAFRPLGSKVVSGGNGEVEFALQVTPVDWGGLTEFKVSANLTPSPHAAGARPLAFSQRELPLKK